VTSDLVTSSPTAQVATPKPSGRPADAWWRNGLRWESGLVLVLIGVIIFGANESKTFLTASTLFYMGINIGYIALMALPLTFVIMTGEIDLSIASMLGLSGAILGILWHHGWGFWPAAIIAVIAGALGGALNGVLVAKVGLPSIAVTIGTLTLYRGLAEVLLGSNTVPEPGDRAFPLSLTKIGFTPLFAHLSFTLVVFVVLAVVFGVVLHGTSLGRSMVAIGLQSEAAQFAGIRVNRIKIWLFVLSGFMAAVAGILLTLQYASVTYNAGTGLELNAVVLVLFGGVSIFGGRGTIFGVVLSVAIVGSLQMALSQMQVSPDVQNIVLGVLLLLSVVVPNGGEVYRRIQTRLRRARVSS
jgi:rhamnose transport system permease protein